MTVSIISVTENGRRLSGEISVILSEKHTVSRYCFYKKSDDASTPFNDINVIVSDIFENSDAIVFISACGIAVRSVAPFVKSKQSDPAVIVIDDCGKYAIPILSGHIGGANHLAEYIADNIGAVPVITTATDVGGCFSPDSFARANGLIITDINVAKAIAAAVLDGEKIGLCSEYQCKNIPSELTQNGNCRMGIYIGSDISKKPFETTLSLFPRNICIGIGCKRGTSLDEIEQMVFNSLREENITPERICSVATIDIKADESGLRQFCHKYKLTFHTFSAEELMNASGDFHRSEFVLKTTGTDNVCERSATKCGEIIMRRKAANGITVAAAEIPVKIDFEKRIL